MRKQPFWDGTKIATLKRMWELELPVAEIAETIGCSKVSVCSKASDLHLGLHPGSRDHRPQRMKGAAIMDRLPAPDDEDEEPTREPRTPKLPKLAFLQRKLQGETSW